MKILVIGELCVDRFIYCDVKRLSPEAPVPVLNPVETIKNRGMAGNVVENLKVLNTDAEVIHWSQNENIVKTRYVDKKSNHMFMRVDDEKIPCKGIGFISPNQKKTISESDIVIISDYDKGYVSESKIKEISSLSKLCLMDSKKKLNYETLIDVDFVKLNYEEYLNNKEICDKNPEKFIITKGRNGTTYNGIDYPSLNPQETIDVSGAGDTFIATFALKYKITGNVSDSIDYTNKVCAYVVNKKGVSLPDERFKIL